MRQKDYSLMLQQQAEVQDAVEWIRQTLSEINNADDDKALFSKHVEHIELVNESILPIIIGLQTKAEAKGRYGFLKYRSDLKQLNTAYNSFEATGNKLNHLSKKYVQSD